MNAVNQYGQEGIAQAPVDFLYTEVWSPNESFKALAQIIRDNNAMSNNSKNTVLAAYINYDLAAQSGYFNTASVLLADAVMFAFGASHLELGEHMLGKEYFPNDNLQMRDDLKNALIHYYDFLVAYQNLLRDGGSFNTLDVQTDNDGLRMEAWPASNGSIAVIGKKFTNKQVVHMINFKDAITDQWRDPRGIQVKPASITDIRVRIRPDKQVKKVWMASPDFNYGAEQELRFDYTGGEVSFVLPHLKYWDMIVLEY
jgi:dextranase